MRLWILKLCQTSSLTLKEKLSCFWYVSRKRTCRMVWIPIRYSKCCLSMEYYKRNMFLMNLITILILILLSTVIRIQARYQVSQQMRKLLLCLNEFWRLKMLARNNVL